MKALAWSVAVATAALAGLMIAGQRMPAAPDAPVTLSATPDCKAYLSAIPRMRRTEFQTAAVGATPERLCGRFGAPERTSQQGERAFWYYDGLTIDPASGRADRSIQVVIDGGTVTAVNF